MQRAFLDEGDGGFRRSTDSCPLQTPNHFIAGNRSPYRGFREMQEMRDFNTSYQSCESPSPWCDEHSRTRTMHSRNSRNSARSETKKYFFCLFRVACTFHVTCRVILRRRRGRHRPPRRARPITLQDTAYRTVRVRPSVRRRPSARPYRDH